MNDLILHKTKGVNPRMTFCSACHEDADELVLLGANDGKYECPKCKCVCIGNPPYKCKTCKIAFRRIGVVGEHERVMAHDICDKCKEKQKEHAEIVKLGGIYWKCDKCHSAGVIRDCSEIAKEVRIRLNVLAPDPCGVDFTDEADTMCPVCSNKHEGEAA